MFVDLVKAYEDTVNHELLFQILERYRAPSQYVDAIRRLYNSVSVIVKISIGTEKAEISQTVGVRQGDNLSPVIFIFLMSACAKSMQDELDARGMMERAKCRKVNLTNPNPNLPISPKTSPGGRHPYGQVMLEWWTKRPGKKRPGKLSACLSHRQAISKPQRLKPPLPPRMRMP